MANLPTTYRECTQRQRAIVARGHMCRVCLVPVNELVEQQRVRVYRNYFCRCIGSQGYTCENCIIQYASRFPDGCPTCNYRWRNITTRRRTYQEYYAVFQQHREMMEVHSISGIAFGMILLMFTFILDASGVGLHGNPTLQLLGFVIVGMVGYHGWTEAGVPSILCYLLYLRGNDQLGIGDVGEVRQVAQDPHRGYLQ